MTSTPVELVERIGYRAPLAIACTDGVTGAAVTDGLVASAWLRTDPAGRRTARRSPLSGLLGFGALPRTWAQTHVQLPAGTPVGWPAAPPTPVCVLVQDTAGRYLPASIAVGVPVAAPVALPLSSSPGRTTASGHALVRGEVHHDTTGAPLGWALVRIDTGAAAYQTVADAQGRFLLPFPHPEALPALTSPPAGPGLGALSWPVTVSVRSKPTTLVFSPGVVSVGGPAAPPELGSITAQPPAQLVDAGTHPSLTVTLPYGIPLVLALRAVTP
ncbi:hypothetical protein GCM10028801_38010 [Nocardioides maradonensis]